MEDDSQQKMSPMIRSNFCRRGQSQVKKLIAGRIPSWADSGVHHLVTILTKPKDALSEQAIGV